MTPQKTEIDSDVLWKQYNMLVDLYKFYLEITLKANLFFYVITGGILTFYFSHMGTPLISLSLVLPIILSLGLAGIFLYGASLVGYIREEIFRIRDLLRLEAAPDVHVLAVFLRVFAVVMLIVAIAMGALVCAHGKLAAAL